MRYRKCMGLEAVLTKTAMKRVMIRFLNLRECRRFIPLRPALKVSSFYELFTRVDAKRDRA